MESSSELSYRSKVLDYIGPTSAAVTWVRRSPIGRWSPSSEYRTPRRPLVLRRPLGGAGLNLRYSSCGDVALQRRRWSGGGGGFYRPFPEPLLSARRAVALVGPVPTARYGRRSVCRCPRNCSISNAPESNEMWRRVIDADRTVGGDDSIRFQTAILLFGSIWQFGSKQSHS